MRHFATFMGGLILGIFLWQRPAPKVDTIVVRSQDGKAAIEMSVKGGHPSLTMKEGGKPCVRMRGQGGGAMEVMDAQGRIRFIASATKDGVAVILTNSKARRKIILGDIGDKPGLVFFDAQGKPLLSMPKQ